MIDLKDSEIRIIGNKTSRANTDPPKDGMDTVGTPPMRQAAAGRHPVAYHRMADNPMLQNDYEEYQATGKSSLKYIITSVAVVVAAIVLAALYITHNVSATGNTALITANTSSQLQASLPTKEPVQTSDEPEEGQFEQMELQEEGAIDQQFRQISMTNTEPGCHLSSLSVNGIPMRLFSVEGATPSLHVGSINANDPSILLAFQAADFRRDNGRIVGACVHHGKVVGEGLAKKGYVAIIRGNVSIGMSDHSPLFEEATQTEGDFFRQYPLVADGRLIENTLKKSSIRRAFCQRQGRHFVVESSTPVSFHDFSQALVDMKVENAVYLVGSRYAHGFCHTADAQFLQWGDNHKVKPGSSITYLVWRK